MSEVTLKLGDCIEKMKELDDCSVDAVVTDPPYGLSKEPDIKEVLTHWLNDDEYEHESGGFMGKRWDSFVPGPNYWREVFRVMKPGAHLLAFGGTRTYDLLVMAIRMAGFEVRDQLAWIYGSGFPKSMNLSKAIDKKTGAKREVVGENPNHRPVSGVAYEGVYSGGNTGSSHITAPATAAAAQWDGWGTALKPAQEPIVMARKPLAEKTVVANVLEQGTGAINIDDCRISTDDTLNGGAYSPGERKRNGNSWGNGVGGGVMAGASGNYEQPQGRWPANVLLGHHDDCELLGTKKVNANQSSRPGAGRGYAKTNNNGILNPGKGGIVKASTADAEGKETVQVWDCHTDCPVKILDDQSSPKMHSAGHARNGSQGSHSGVDDGDIYAKGLGEPGYRYGDSGGASRFFYQAKSSKKERNKGCEGLFWTKEGQKLSKDEYEAIPERDQRQGNIHVTVKPIPLMQYLVRLVTPPGGTVMDPFMGSGTTGIAAKKEGFDFIGIELEESSFEISKARISAHGANADSPADTAKKPEAKKKANVKKKRPVDVPWSK